MRTDPLKWWMASVRRALLAALILVGLALVTPGLAVATPIEEDIPQSPAPRHVRPRPVLKSPDESDAATDRSLDTTSVQPASVTSPSTDSPTDMGSGSVTRSDTNPVAPPHEHKYFPYTIRSGDTLEAIADLFGVQVTDITHANRRLVPAELMAGDTIRIPNPFVTREAELNAEVERLSLDKQEAERKAEQATNSLAGVHSQLESAAASNAHYERDLHSLPWWRAAAWSAAIAGVVMFGMMLAAIIEWWSLRWRYRAVAEMNDSLRRLDYRYRMVMAKAELRMQELYGRRRRGIEEGNERPKIPEEIELERLDLQIKDILESYLERLGPPNRHARRARWRELIGTVGAPVEARTVRR